MRPCPGKACEQLAEEGLQPGSSGRDGLPCSQWRCSSDVLSLTWQPSRMHRFFGPTQALPENSVAAGGKTWTSIWEKGNLFEKLTNQVETKKTTITALRLRGLKCNHKNNNYRSEPDKGYQLNLTPKILWQFIILVLKPHVWFVSKPALYPSRI